MKTLVLCVDRDNDIGEKAGMNCPIIGREGVLDAAVALGIADPEDSDTNTILAGLSMYDDLLRKGVEAEISLIAGDRHVGFTSDQIMVTQLENVLAKVQPTNVFLVSDGAEDEYVFPMVSSRVKVDSIRRVIVRQSKSLESLYYMITKSLTETKTRNRIYLPFAMVLLIYATLVLTGYQRYAFASIMLALGAYLMWVTLDATNRIKKTAKGAKESVFQGRVIVPFSLIAVAIFAMSIIYGLRAYIDAGEGVSKATMGLGIFIAYLAWSIIVFEAGLIIDVIMRAGRIPTSFWVFAPTLFAFGMAILFSMSWVETRLEIEHVKLLNYTYLEIASTALLTVTGAVYWWVRRRREAARQGSAQAKP